MDIDWVRRAQAGEHEAFAAIAAASISSLHRTARLILRDDDWANDAVQEALTTAWLDIRGLRDPAAIDAWLRRLLVRACFRVAGRERRERAGPTVAHVRTIELASTPDASPEVELRDQVDRAFRRLTPDQRAVLVVRHYLDLTDDQAAEALGIPRGTVKSRLNRATAAFRAAIEADERSLENPREVTA